VTTALAMPNLSPTPDSAENLAVEEDIIKRDSIIRIYPFGCVSVGEKGECVADYDGMQGRIIGLSDDGVGVNNIDVLKEAMRWAKEHNTIIASHAEYEGLGTSPEAEYLAVECEIKLASEIGCKYHFCHISTERSFKAIKNAQLNGVDVTCEVTPHHLLLCDEDINNDANFKMNPPLRSRSDRVATVRALLDGTASIIASDHAPHSETEKQKEYNSAPNGIIGFETTLPLIYTNFVKTGVISRRRFLELTVYNPAARFGLSRNGIEEGAVADIAVLDIINPHIYTREEILSKGRNTPFIGRALYGKNVLTLVDGKVVYKDTIYFR
jgi:Dihydroorotase and related cyclic amidohydrolases